MKTKVFRVCMVLAVVAGVVAFSTCTNPVESVTPQMAQATGNLTVKVKWPVANTNGVNSPYEVPLTDKTQAAETKGSLSKTIGFTVGWVQIRVQDSQGNWYYATLANTGSGSLSATLPSSGAMPAGGAFIYATGYRGTGYSEVCLGQTAVVIPNDGTSVSATISLMDYYNYYSHNTVRSAATGVGFNYLYEDLSLHDPANEDWYFTSLGDVGSGMTLEVDTYNDLYTDVDNIVEIYDSTGNLIAAGNGTQAQDIVVFTAYTSWQYYYIRVRSGGSLGSPTGNYTLMVRTFPSAGTVPLLIQEVHAASSPSCPNWVVIYNPSATEAVDLSQYSASYNGGSFSALPSYTLQPGQRVRVLDAGSTQLYINEVVSTAAMPWTTAGSVELTKGTEGIDFVSWGGAGGPQYSGPWSGYTGLQPTAPGYVVERIWTMTPTQAYLDFNRCEDFRVGPYAAEVEPNDTRAAANATNTPVVIEGAIAAGTSDWFEVDNTTGSTQSMSFVTSRPIAGINMDTRVELYDESGTYLAGNDDWGEGNYSAMEYTLEAGQRYFVKVAGQTTGAAGGYALMIFGPPTVTTGISGPGGSVVVTVE